MRDSQRPIDSALADALLSGHVSATDHEDGTAAVASLLDGMTRHAMSDPAPALVVAMAATARISVEPTTGTTRKRLMITKVLTTKLAAVTAVLVFTATGAAAATGTLPDAAQDGVAKAAGHVGINLPDSANDKARDATEDRGQDSGGAPSEENHGTDVSGVATETEATGADKGAEISTTARDGHGRAPAASPDTPAATGTDSNPAPVDTPNPGGTATADGASDGASSTGTSTANDAADDASANADDHSTGRP